MSMDRRMFLQRMGSTAVAVGAGGSLTAFLSACGKGDSSTTAELPSGLAQAGTTIPQQSVKMGLSPNGDELLPVIGVKRGYYADVGIAIRPKPYGARTDLLSSLTPLLNGQVAVGSAYPPTVFPQLDTVTNVRAFALSDVFYGYRILAPKGKYQTVAQLMKQGQSFEAAAKTAVAQMRGKTFLRNEATSPTFFNLAFELGGLKKDDFKLVLLDNPGVVRAALAGRGDFAAPTGGVDIQELQTKGWEPIIEVRQLIENLPDKSLPLRANNSGFLATDDYIRDNYETVLRLTSVMYRIIDDFERDVSGTVEVYRDFSNSYTGNDLSNKEMVELLKTEYPFRDFDAAADFYVNKTSAFYLPPAYDAQLADLKQGGVLKKEHTYSDLLVADRVWKDLKRYRDEADKLFQGEPGKDKALAAKAKKHYDARNYLDAYRFLASATAGSA